MSRRPNCCRRRIATSAVPIGCRRASAGPTRAGLRRQPGTAQCDRRLSAPPWRNGPASGCRSTGPRRRTTSATRSDTRAARERHGAAGGGGRRLSRRACRNGPASGCRSTGRRRRTISASRSGHSGSARAARRGWRRRSPPIVPRWRNGPASACRSTGPRRRTTSATRSGRSGERESGTARLEEAVAAYRAALEEQTRERVPLDWATTQNNLGNALWTLGERESGTARLEEAVAAYRAALEEQTRERVPLDWATTQNNLGNALRTLGERESGTARLEEAVAAYRAALEERTRERVPLDWADDAEQPRQRAPDARASARAARRGWRRRSPPIAPRWRNGPASGCRSTGPRRRTTSATRSGHSGERESGTARLEEAVAAYRAALEERTRERVPLDWADDAEQPRQRALDARASARAARRGWRRRSPPIAPRWRNGPASGCRSTGP